MKKIVLLFFLFLALAEFSHAQKAEILYFKAELPCCRARACDALEADIKSIVEKNFSKESIVFKQIKLADEANKDLIDKYKAKSQTVMAIINQKKNQGSIDLSDIVRNYTRTGNKSEFEKELVAKIKEGFK